jgi:acyl carrier protein
MANVTWERVQTIIVQQLGVSESEVVPSASFVDDFGTDWLDLEELRMAIEEEYEIVISKEDFANLPTAGDVLGYLIKVIG